MREFTTKQDFNTKTQALLLMKIKPCLLKKKK